MNEKIQDFLNLIQSEPNSIDYILYEDGQWTVTTEWLVGTFCGRGFEGDTLEAAAEQQIDYLSQHLQHDSCVGDMVTRSGWPNLVAVKAWLEQQREIA